MVCLGRKAQPVDVLVPTAVLHVMQAVPGPPVVANRPEQLFGTRRRDLRPVNRRQHSRLTSPAAMPTLSFSTITDCMAQGIPSPPGYSRPVQPGEEGNAGHGGLAADQAHRVGHSIARKGCRLHWLSGGAAACSRHQNSDSAASISTHSHHSPVIPFVYSPSLTSQSSWSHK